MAIDIFSLSDEELNKLYQDLLKVIDNHKKDYDFADVHGYTLLHYAAALDDKAKLNFILNEIAKPPLETKYFVEVVDTEQNAMDMKTIDIIRNRYNKIEEKIKEYQQRIIPTK